MGVLKKLCWHQSHQAVFHFHNVLARSNASSVGYPENMSGHRHGQLPECCVQNHVSGFAADPGQGFEVFPVIGNSTVVLFNQYAAGFDDVFCFAVEQPDGLDTVSYTHLRAHETDSYLVCRLLLEKKKKKNI